ncbi:hypothetical protein [Mycolicibacterium hippocampi]|uniref:hypothetical protein n=1 Tax=Mycolicibacterium hippocampi TaxID=659824 RepID=UPI0035169EFC
MTPATTVTVFHSSEDAGDFARSAQELLTSAMSASGYVSERVLLLQGGQRRGYWQSAVDVILTGDGSMRPGWGCGSVRSSVWWRCSGG